MSTRVALNRRQAQAYSPSARGGGASRKRHRPGALFTEASRYQAWLDVEAALAQAQAELGIIPGRAADEIAQMTELLDPAQCIGLCRQFAEEGAARARHTVAALTGAGFPVLARPD